MTTNGRASRSRGAPGSIHGLVAALLLAGCAGNELPTVTEPPPGNRPAETERAPPTGLDTGDRWYVVTYRENGFEPLAMRSRRRAQSDGAVHEVVTWGRSFVDVSRGIASSAPTIELRLTDRGLENVTLEHGDRSGAEGAVEIAYPLEVGTRWRLSRGGRSVDGEISGVEDIDTAGGRVPGALRVVHAGEALVMTTWYDSTLRPVRAEVRDAEGLLVEARAMLGSPRPGAEECRGAVEWARKYLR